MSLSHGDSLKKNFSFFLNAKKTIAALIVAVLLFQQPLWAAKEYGGQHANLNALFPEPKLSDALISAGITVGSALVMGGGKFLGNFGQGAFNATMAQTATNLAVHAFNMSPGTAQIFGYAFSGAMNGAYHGGFSSAPILKGTMQGAMIGAGTVMAYNAIRGSGFYKHNPMIANQFASLVGGAAGHLLYNGFAAMAGANIGFVNAQGKPVHDFTGGISAAFNESTFQQHLISTGVALGIEYALGPRNIQYSRILGSSIGQWATGGNIGNALLNGALQGAASVALISLGGDYNSVTGRNRLGLTSTEMALANWSATGLVHTALGGNLKDYATGFLQNFGTFGQTSYARTGWASSLYLIKLAEYNGIAHFNANANWMIRTTGKPWSTLVADGQVDKIIPSPLYSLVNYTRSSLHEYAVQTIANDAMLSINRLTSHPARQPNLEPSVAPHSHVRLQEEQRVRYEEEQRRKAQADAQTDARGVRAEFPQPSEPTPILTGVQPVPIVPAGGEPVPVAPIMEPQGNYGPHSAGFDSVAGQPAAVAASPIDTPVSPVGYNTGYGNGPDRYSGGQQPGYFTAPAAFSPPAANQSLSSLPADYKPTLIDQTTGIMVTRGSHPGTNSNPEVVVMAESRFGEKYFTAPVNPNNPSEGWYIYSRGENKESPVGKIYYHDNVASILPVQNKNLPSDLAHFKGKRSLVEIPATTEARPALQTSVTPVTPATVTQSLPPSVRTVLAQNNVSATALQLGAGSSGAAEAARARINNGVSPVAQSSLEPSPSEIAYAGKAAIFAQGSYTPVAQPADSIPAVSATSRDVGSAIPAIVPSPVITQPAVAPLPASSNGVGVDTAARAQHMRILAGQGVVIPPPASVPALVVTPSEVGIEHRVDLGNASAPEGVWNPQPVVIPAGGIEPAVATPPITAQAALDPSDPAWLGMTDARIMGRMAAEGRAGFGQVPASPVVTNPTATPAVEVSAQPRTIVITDAIRGKKIDATQAHSMGFGSSWTQGEFAAEAARVAVQETHSEQMGLSEKVPSRDRTILTQARKLAQSDPEFRALLGWQFDRATAYNPGYVEPAKGRLGITSSGPAIASAVQSQPAYVPQAGEPGSREHTAGRIALYNDMSSGTAPNVTQNVTGAQSMQPYPNPLDPVSVADDPNFRPMSGLIAQPSTATPPVMPASGAAIVSAPNVVSAMPGIYEQHTFNQVMQGESAAQLSTVPSFQPATAVAPPQQTAPVLSESVISSGPQSAARVSVSSEPMVVVPDTLAQQESGGFIPMGSRTVEPRYTERVMAPQVISGQNVASRQGSDPFSLYQVVDGNRRVMDVYHIEYDTVDNQNRAFSRLSDYIEVKGSTGSIPDGEVETGAAHDLELTDVANFFNAAEAQGKPLLPAEQRLLVSLKDNGLLQRNYNTQRFESLAGRGAAIITAPSNVDQAYNYNPGELRPLVVGHELNHAMFFSNPEYEAEAKKWWNSNTPEQRAALTSLMGSFGAYNPKDERLVVREAFAYFSEPGGLILKGQIDDLTTKNPELGRQLSGAGINDSYISRTTRQLSSLQSRYLGVK